MSWLSDWAKRIEITVDNTNIDSDITHFPVPIVLGASVGQSNDDVSAVFDELTSDGNRKKIAVTKSDGTTQLYVEIELWDDANEAAVLWATKSDLTITSDSTTTLYLYYDSTKADNTTYIGDIGDAVAQNVWDSNFKAVLHMNQDPTGGSDCIKDSTSNGNHGTPNGSMTSGDLIDGIVGKCLEFDGSDDYISIGSDSSLSNIGTDSTIEASIKVPDVSGVKDIFEAYESNFYRSELFVSDDEFCTGNYTGHGCTTSSPISSSTWQNLVLTIDATWQKKYVDTVLHQSISGGGSLDDLGTWTATIGKEVEDSNPFSGAIDEVRISDTVRSYAWRVANHHAIADNLLTFLAEESYTIALSSSLPSFTGSFYTGEWFSASLPQFTTSTLFGLHSSASLPQFTTSTLFGLYLSESLPSIDGSGHLCPLTTGELKYFDSLYPGQLPALEGGGNDGQVADAGASLNASLPDRWSLTSDCNVGTVCTLSQELPALTALGSCKVGRVCTLSLSLPSFSMDSRQGAGFGKDLPELELTASLTVSPTVSLSRNLPKLSLSATSTTGETASLAKQLPRLSLSAESKTGATGTLSISLPMVTANIRTGNSLTYTLPSFTTSLSGKTGATLTLEELLPSLTISATGTAGIIATFSQELPMVTLSGVSTGTEPMTCSMTLPSFLFAARGSEHTRFGDYVLQFNDW